MFWRRTGLPWVRVMWSSRNTLDQARGAVLVLGHALVLVLGHVLVLGLKLASWVEMQMSSGGNGSAAASSQCGGCSLSDCSAALVRSVTISVAMQKKGGELVHPMGKASRNATRAGCPIGVGNTTPKSGMWCRAKCIQ